jgi:hypothetical protein
MSLSDLKKKHNHQHKKKSFTVDEFILDAENYAKGAPTIVNNAGEKAFSADVNISQAILLAKQHLEEKKKSKHKPFRRATFTLSEDAIEQLTQLSEGTDLAKSHIIRILINELCNKDQRERLQKLLESHTD